MIDYLENLELKKGDKIECIDPRDGESLIDDKIYKVIKHNGDLGIINEFNIFVTDSFSKFRKVKNNKIEKNKGKNPWCFETGSLLECVKEDEGFTKGNIYILGGKNDTIFRQTLINDNNMLIGETNAKFILYKGE